MATAKRLYLYVVSAAGLILMVVGAAILLDFLLNKVGVGPQPTGGSSSDRDTVSLAIALGLVGFVVWLVHWSIVERMVSGRLDVAAESIPGAADAAAAERRSIVRSVFLALVSWVSLVCAATLGAGLAGRAIADALGASQGLMLSVSSISVMSLLPIDDAWSLSIIIVLCATWAYHAWIRSRDVRQGPAIKGAAAWVSRFYLYYAALTGLFGVLENLSSLINTAATQVAQPDQLGFPSDINLQMPTFTTSDSSAWERPAIAALVGIVIYGAMWLIHWTYSNRLYAGSSEQSSFERSSRVRLAFLMSVLVYGAVTMVGGFGSGLGQLFSSGLGVGSLSRSGTWFSFHPLRLCRPDWLGGGTGAGPLPKRPRTRRASRRGASPVIWWPWSAWWPWLRVWKMHWQRSSGSGWRRRRTSFSRTSASPISCGNRRSHRMARSCSSAWPSGSGPGCSPRAGARLLRSSVRQSCIFVARLLPVRHLRCGRAGPRGERGSPGVPMPPPWLWSA